MFGWNTTQPKQAMGYMATLQKCVFNIGKIIIWELLFLQCLVFISLILWRKMISSKFVFDSRSVQLTILEFFETYFRNFGLQKNIAWYLKMTLQTVMKNNHQMFIREGGEGTKWSGTGVHSFMNTGKMFRK